MSVYMGPNESTAFTGDKQIDKYVDVIGRERRHDRV